MDKEPLVSRAEVDRLKERADVFNTFIRDLMERMERAEKELADLKAREKV
jgi:hypothetical protein